VLGIALLIKLVFPFWRALALTREEAMALLNCRHCGNQVSSTAPLCPSCGGTYPGGVMRASIPAFILMGIVAVIALIVFAMVA
jgi:hypothetical protein